MAVPYVTVGDFVDNLEVQCETFEVGALLIDWLETWKDENPDYLDLTFSRDDINALLKALTGCIVATGTDLNCYPTGLSTAILFDIDGNLLP
jgi:hypothetical protein